MWVLLLIFTTLLSPVSQSSRCELFAQAFTVPSEESHGEESGVDGDQKKTKATKHRKNKKIKNEKDLWSMPDEGDSKDEEPEIDLDEQEKDNSAEQDEQSQDSEEKGSDEGWGDVSDHGKKKNDQTNNVTKEEKHDNEGNSITLVPLIPKNAVSKKELPKKEDNVKGAKDKDSNAKKAVDSREKVTSLNSQELTSTGSVPDMAAEGSILPVSGSRKDLNRLWQQRRIHLDQRDFELAKADFARFMALRKELAIRDLYPHAWVLIHNAQAAARREDSGQARRLLDAAIELAPDLPAAYLARASHNFSESPFGIGTLWDDIYKAAMTSLKNPLVSNRLLVNLIFSLLLGFALAIVLFVLVELLKNIRLFIHDFHHLFPRGVAHFQSGLLAIILLLLPVLLRTGPVIVVLSWLAVGWMYQGWRARTISILSLLFIAGFPLALQFATARMSMTQGIFSDAIDVVTGPGHLRSLNALRTKLAEHDDKLILASLASYAKRQGDLAKARELYNRALALDQDSVVLLNNLGNVLFLEGDLKGALRQYIRATNVRPDVVEPYFNLSRAYFRSADLDKGKESIKQAIRISHDRVMELRKQAAARVVTSLDGVNGDPSVAPVKASLANYTVADLAIPNEWFYQVNDEDSSNQLFSNLLMASTGFSSLISLWIVCAGALVFLLILVAMRRRIFSSNACVRCGRPACRICSPELRDDSVCGQCFYVFIKKSQVDARSRISKEIQVRKFRRRKATISTGINFLLAGVGQIIKGRVLRGALILLVFCLVLMQVLAGEYFVRDTISMGSWRNWLLLAPGLALFLMFYIWSVLDSFRDES